MFIWHHITQISHLLIKLFERCSAEVRELLVFATWHYLFLLAFACYFNPMFAQTNITFQEQTEQAGLVLDLNAGSGTNGVALADYNGDDLTDIYFVVRDSYKETDSSTWNQLFANNGDGTFRKVEGAGGASGMNNTPFESQMGYKLGAAWGDIDNDGYPDLFLSHAGPDQLYYNNGDGTFRDITSLAGVAGDSLQVSSSALWFDYNLDGLLDLYVSVWDEKSIKYNDGKNRLYKNNGDLTFKKIDPNRSGQTNAMTWTTVAFDVNEDGLPDLYLANDFGENTLLINNGDDSFTEATGDYGLKDAQEGMGLALGDPDNNGKPDIYVTNLTEKRFGDQTNPLFMNMGSGHFEDLASNAGVSKAGWGWGTAFTDINNDGWEDLAVVNGFITSQDGNRFFLNTGNQEHIQFKDISKQSGFHSTEEARGVAVFDYDNDGYQDILVSNFRDQPHLYQNQHSGDNNNWLAITLEGTDDNRDALGATVRISTPKNNYTKRVHGTQFLAQNLLPLHIGLGDEESVQHIEVIWPGGKRTLKNDVRINQLVYYKQPKETSTAIDAPGSRSNDNDAALTKLNNYPNPFNGSTTIQFRLNEAGTVTLDIYDLQGKHIDRITKNYKVTGDKSIKWNTAGFGSQSAATGIYIYTLLLNGGMKATGKMIYLK